MTRDHLTVTIPARKFNNLPGRLTCEDIVSRATTRPGRPVKPKTFRNAQEFTRYIERVTSKPFKPAASTEGSTAHKYLSGQRDLANLFTDSDLIAILNDKHPDGGLLYVFSDYSSVIHKPKIVQ
jgi:hypothetical protein